MTLEEAQKQVDQWVKTYGVQYECTAAGYFISEF